MKLLSSLLANAADRRLVGNFLARRDELSFRELYRRHTPSLYQLSLRLVGLQVHLADDVVQEAWTKAVEGLAAFRWESTLRTWLCGIVVNCCHELYRRQGRQNSTPLDEAEIAGIAPGGGAEYIDLEQAIASLPPGYRHILVLHDIEGYTHDEIGRMLDIEAGTSKSQLFHARRTVRKALQGEKQVGESQDEPGT